MFIHEATAGKQHKTEYGYKCQSVIKMEHVIGVQERGRSVRTGGRAGSLELANAVYQSRIHCLCYFVDFFLILISPPWKYL